MVWAYFSFCTHLNFQHMKIKKSKWSYMFLGLFCGLLVFQSWICPFLGFRWLMCKSRNLSLPWCLFPHYILCSLGTKFWGSSMQGLYFHNRVWAFTIFLEAVLKKNSDYFHGEQSETEKSWWQKCQSSEGPSVPVWAQHSGVFRFQTFCLLPGLCTMMVVVVVVVVVVTTVAEVVVTAVVMMMVW